MRRKKKQDKTRLNEALNYPLGRGRILEIKEFKKQLCMFKINNIQIK